jgi:hypothetical protein
MDWLMRFNNARIHSDRIVISNFQGQNSQKYRIRLSLFGHTLYFEFLGVRKEMPADVCDMIYKKDWARNGERRV